MPDDKKKPKPIKLPSEELEKAIEELEDKFLYPKLIGPEKKAKGGLIKGVGIAKKGFRPAKKY